MKAHRSHRKFRRRGRSHADHRVRLYFEALEDRQLLTASPTCEFADNGSSGEGEPADWRAELTGSIVTGGTTHALSISPRAEHQGALIDPTQTTWLVIHGRLGAAAQSIYQDIAAAIDGYTPGDQVLLLDWETAATGFIDGELRIEPVGRWAAAALDDYGFDADDLNLLGYSWGAHVADELAEELMTLQAERVNSLLVLDPAADVPFNSYNPNNSATVNFAAHSKYSWAFHASDFEGSETSPKTAHEAFVVQGSNHYEIRSQFIRILETNHGGQFSNQSFSLERLLNRGVPSAPWLPNAVNGSGGVSSNATGRYEAVIQMDASGRAQWLSYEPLTGPTDQFATEPFWSSAPPEAVNDVFAVDMADWTGALLRDAASGVLANDSGMGLAAAQTMGPDQGDLTLLDDGSFTYTPWAQPTPFGFGDQFTYEVTDQAGQTDVATVQIVGVPNLHNAALPTDVDAGGWATPLDVLLVINALDRFGAQAVAELVALQDVPVYFYDVNGDDQLTAADALAAINEWNTAVGHDGEGEDWADCPRSY
jgi:hypothetical protein